MTGGRVWFLVEFVVCAASGAQEVEADAYSLTLSSAAAPPWWPARRREATAASGRRSRAAAAARRDLRVNFRLVSSVVAQSS